MSSYSDRGDDYVSERKPYWLSSAPTKLAFKALLGAVIGALIAIATGWHESWLVAGLVGLFGITILLVQGLYHVVYLCVSNRETHKYLLTAVVAAVVAAGVVLLLR